MEKETMEDIKNRFKNQHQELSDRYYKEKELSKEQFDWLHGHLWSDMEAELTEAGYLLPLEVLSLSDRVAALEARQPA